MKLLLPLVIALVGLGVGVGAGVALKPAPEPVEEAHAATCAEGEHCEPDPHADAGAAKPADHAGGKSGGKSDGGSHDAAEYSVVPLDKPFVVPVFSGDKVIAMVVASVAVEVDSKSETMVEAATPRLRDAMLAAMFRHANSGGFDGTFTAGRKMEDLRAALLVAAREVFEGVAVKDVLITEIAKQDV